MPQSAEDRFAFLDLTEELFRELRVEPPPPRTFDDSLPLTVSVGVDGQAFDVSHDPGPSGPSSLVLECRFGSVPSMPTVPALTRLLEANAVLDPHGGAGFGIDERSGDVICTRLVPLAGMSARKLLDDLGAMAGLAAYWQETFFLTSTDPPDPRVGVESGGPWSAA